MVKFDEDALMCDLAETYQIYDYKQLPVSLVAVFSCGLRNDSRIKMKMNDQKVSLDTMLLARVSDDLRTIIWSKTEDGQKNKNRPESIVGLLSSNPKQEKDVVVFTSGEDFENARQKLIVKANEGGGSNGD
ncbi:DUF5361 domain-containing protein [Enterococcus dispar]|uniref:DUF5361 domain-containing protein n=1 Tax=Enterococcus dispar TaxID=44009 RepID=UPI00249282F4|nr:DUF5361 domain-containing protein [Enterococcus dispar]